MTYAAETRVETTSTKRILRTAGNENILRAITENTMTGEEMRTSGKIAKFKIQQDG